MKKILQEIQDGTFAKGWIAENEKGRPNFKAARVQEAKHRIEEVGATLRAAMPFLDPVKVENNTVVKAGQAVAAAA